MLSESIKKLVQYGVESGITPECERIYTTNLLLDVFGESEYTEPEAEYAKINLEEVLNELLDEAVKRGIIEDRKQTNNQSEVKTMYEDKTLVCKDCGKEFTFSAGEQEFYAEKGFENEPQRCKECRQARKNSMRQNKEMYEIVCASCGKVDKVPFEPRNDKPVYCSECFAKQNN